MPYTPTTWTEGVTKLGPTNMNHLETGISNVTTTADAAIAKPASPASNDALVWNGSTWVNAKLVNANIDPAAAIVYSKLSLAGGIVNNDINASAAIALSKLADPGSGNVVTSAGAGAIAAKPPGYRYSLDSFTANVTSTATTEAGATTVKTSSSVTYDGTAVWIEFQCAVLSSSGAGGGIWLSFFDGATAIGKVRFGSDANGVASPGLVRVPFTPSAGAHTFTVKIWATTASTVTAFAAAGGTDTQLPGFIQVIKA